MTRQTGPGRPWPMGASLTATGVNFAVFSAHATALELCLFNAAGDETDRLPFARRTGDIWHLEVAGIGPGQAYGLRAHGPHDPGAGHRFNPAKLLIDPCARALDRPLRWCAAMQGHLPAGPGDRIEPDGQDSAAVVAKSLVVDGRFDWQDDRPPLVPLAETVIYEAHVKALTINHPAIPADQRGRYGALGHPALIAHLHALGVTAVELLPIHARLDDRFVLDRGLVNHWGYNTIGFFAPDPRHGSLDELKAAIRALHRAGIEVILDVVFNHSGEGDADGPTLCFRGLDNASYYRLDAAGHDLNDAGTGNTLDASHPAVLRMIMDSLRYWAQEVHVDGFRLDLATVLGRDRAGGFSPRAALFQALLQDPALAHVKLIAEPWDIGEGGYRLGQFPPRFCEWNDRFRDGVRRFWRGDALQTAELARGLLGSAAQFDRPGRGPYASVNFITAHDGFTLADLTSYAGRHNAANGEGNRDGHAQNHSDNLGIEGPTDEPAILAARALRQRNLLATLCLAQGVPMILAGDEMGHSQGGNNNAYAQDNATTWLGWADHDLARFIARMTALRRSHPALRQERFLHGRARRDGLADVIWRRPDGQVPAVQDWHDPGFRCLGVELRMAAGGDEAGTALFATFNAGGPVALSLPDTAPAGWRCLLDSTRPDAAAHDVPARLDLPGQSVLVFAAKVKGDA